MTRVVALYLALGLGLSLTSGCAFGTRHATITYPPVGAKTSSVAAAKPAVSSGRIALPNFTDERPNKQAVGYVLNGFGMRTAKVVCDNPNLSQLVTDAVRTELKSSGYEVLSASDPLAADVTTLCGSLTKVYCDAYFTYDGTVILTVQFKRGGQDLYKQSYQGKGGVGMNWGATGDSYGQSLSLALADAIHRMIQDLPGALKN